MNELCNLGLLTEAIGNGFFVVVNTNSRSRKNTIQVVNRPQMKALEALECGEDIATIGLRAEDCGKIMKRFRQIGLLTRKTWRESSVKPLNIWMHLTNGCTLRCSYCRIPKNPNHMSPDVMDQLLVKLLTSVRAGDLNKVTLRLSGGEPTTRFREIAEFIPRAGKALKAEGCRFKAVFLTNLTIMNADLLGFISDNGIGVSASLDGVGEWHDQSRKFPNGKGSFSQVERNLDILQGAGINPYIMTVVTNGNLEGIPEHVGYLIDRDLGFRLQIAKGNEAFNMGAVERMQRKMSGAGWLYGI